MTMIDAVTGQSGDSREGADHRNRIAYRLLLPSS
jgi:hypothetical protein